MSQNGGKKIGASHTDFQEFPHSDTTHLTLAFSNSAWFTILVPRSH